MAPRKQSAAKSTTNAAIIKTPSSNFPKPRERERERTEIKYGLPKLGKKDDGRPTRDDEGKSSSTTTTTENDARS